MHPSMPAVAARAALLVVAAAALPACTPSGDPAGFAGLGIHAFTAAPEAPHPGETVTLTAIFSGGTGAIEGVGAVVSGAGYDVGPSSASRTFTLVVTSADVPPREVRRDLVVPLLYRHVLAPRPPSPSARCDHAGAVLADGRVLVVGGSSSGGTGWDTADLVDPVTGAHVYAGDLWTARVGAEVVALPDGGALVVGGNTDVGDRRSVERWDPGAGGFTRLADLVEKRFDHTVTSLPSGEVLVAGSDAFLGAPAATHAGAELYDPGTGQSRPPVGNDMIQARFGHSATRLPDGRVLLVGGWDAYSGVAAVSAEVFDPGTETFTLAGSLLEPRGGHVAVLLPDGRVLVAGGGDFDAALAAEIWSPESGTFSPAGTLATPRFDHGAALLGSGEVLLIGGRNGAGETLATAETWRAGEPAFTPRGNVLGTGRRGFVLAILRDGRVLVHGGEPGDGFPVHDVAVYE